MKWKPSNIGNSWECWKESIRRQSQTDLSILILIFDSFLYAAYISSILFYDYCYSRRAVVVIVCCWYLVSYLSNKFLSFSQTNPNRNQLNVLSISSWSHFSVLWFSVGRICSIFHLVSRLKSELRFHMQRHRKCVRIL